MGLSGSWSLSVRRYKMFSSPFDIDIKKVSSLLQMELINTV